MQERPCDRGRQRSCVCANGAVQVGTGMARTRKFAQLEGLFLGLLHHLLAVPMSHVGARPGRRQSPHNREWRGRSAPRFGRSGVAQQPLSRVVSGAAPHPCCARCLEPRGASSTPHAALALQGVSTTREEMRYNACASFKEHTTAFPSALFASEAGTWALKGLFPARG